MPTPSLANTDTESSTKADIHLHRIKRKKKNKLTNRYWFKCQANEADSCSGAINAKGIQTIQVKSLPPRLATLDRENKMKTENCKKIKER